MTPDDPSPQAARRLRPFGRRRVPDGDDSVGIGSDDTHAWWAQRDDLDNVVNPKKRGAAARRAEGHLEPPLTRRSARSSAAPPATEWDPDDAFRWRIPGGPRAHMGAQSPTAPPGRAATTPPPTASPPPPPRPEPAPETQTPWDVLGLTVDATWDEVSRRHKQLAKQHHPDRHAQDDVENRAQAENMMSTVNAAFSELGRIYRLMES